MPAGMRWPHISSSAAHRRVTTGTTEYLRSDSCRRHQISKMLDKVLKMPSCGSHICQQGTNLHASTTWKGYICKCQMHACETETLSRPNAAIRQTAV